MVTVTRLRRGGGGCFIRDFGILEGGGCKVRKVSVRLVVEEEAGGLPECVCIAAEGLVSVPAKIKSSTHGWGLFP